jgi:DNA polymerase III epsilon subunit family exonuclease
MRFSLLQPLIDVPIAVVDTETTGASAALGHKVIEIGIVRIERGQVVARYEQLVDPGRRISPGVTYLTGISQAMVDGQLRFKDRLPEIMQLFEGAAILGHNIRFDLSFLHAECRRAGADLCQALGDIPVFDTVRIARRRFGRGGNSLPVLSRKLGVDPVVSHRALADAVTTAGVFDKLLEPVGGYNLSLCDTFAQQGGPMDLARSGSAANLLPLELEEALEAQKPVMMEYLDARGARTHRAIKPLHVRRAKGELLLIAHCHLREDRRTFKLDRIVRLTRLEEGVPVPSVAEGVEACATADETALPEPQLFQDQ